MGLLFTFSLGLLLIIIPLSTIVDKGEMSIDDLLTPEPLSINKTGNGTNQFTQRSMEQNNIDDLLGPKDNFPFLPDNHRDSGTGKFNSF